MVLAGTAIAAPGSYSGNLEADGIGPGGGSIGVYVAAALGLIGSLFLAVKYEMRFMFAVVMLIAGCGLYSCVQRFY